MPVRSDSGGHGALLMVYRVDAGTMGKVERTPQGGIRVQASLTRSGVFEYPAPGGKKIREYRAPEEVSRADSLATLVGAPVTYRHPIEGRVTPANFARFARGHVATDARYDSEAGLVEAELFVQDAEALAAIERGEREVSCGYSCDVDETPGLTPQGEKYDRRQVNIRYNHVAIVPAGRAGRQVRLRLDANDDLVADEAQDKGERMKQVRIDGVDYEVGTDSYIQARERQVKQLSDRADSLERELEKEKGRADATEAKLQEAEAKLQEASDPKRLDEAVAARIELVKRARSVLGDQEKLDGLTDREIRERAIAKAKPGLELGERADAYVEAYFESITDPERVADWARRAAHAVSAGAGDAARADGADTSEGAAKRRADEAATEAWKQPLTMSKRASA